MKYEVLYEVRDEGSGLLDRKWRLRRNGKVLRRSKVTSSRMVIDACRMANREARRDGVTVRLRVQDLEGTFRERFVTPDSAREEAAAIREICVRALGVAGPEGETGNPGGDAMAEHFNPLDAGPPDTPEDPTIGIIEEIAEIVAKADRALAESGQGDFDRSNSRNDWIAYVNAYTGRAAQKVFRNEREKCEFRDNMLKAAGLIVSAIRAHDQGWC